MLGLALSVAACSNRRPISSGPYQALKCGLNPSIAQPSKFVFHKNNGSLYYFDLLTNSFKPITRRVEEALYFNSMEELFSRLKGNKLMIKQINYFDNNPQRKSIIKKTINLKSLVMYTVYQNRNGKPLKIKENCIWIDPKSS